MESFLHVGLAPSFGKLNAESVKQMDEKLKICIASTMRTLEGIKKKDDTSLEWDTVISTLMQNPILEPANEGEIDHNDIMTKNDNHWFKIDGSADRGVVEEASTDQQFLVAYVTVLLT